MPGVGGPELVSAVAEAGGLAMIGLPLVPAPLAADILDHLTTGKRGAIGVNFLMPFFDPRGARGRGVARSRHRVLLRRSRSRAGAHRGRGGALVSWQVGSADEARAGRRRLRSGGGAGRRSGWTRAGSAGLLATLSRVLDAVSVPVVAAGESAARATSPRRSRPARARCGSAPVSSRRANRALTPTTCARCLPRSAEDSISPTRSRRAGTRRTACCGPASRPPERFEGECGLRTTGADGFRSSASRSCRPTASPAARSAPWRSTPAARSSRRAR